MLAEATTSATATRSDVIAALHQASAATGSDFDYLLGTAMRESSLKPQAKSGSSSATGLFQFVEQTWLGMVKEHGAKYGLGSYANAITKGANGRYQADNAADRQAILALRNDPTAAALMAGEYANDTKSTLESRLGRGVCNGELYAAHFLGAGAACRLIKMSDADPTASAAAAFPRAASANHHVFYHRDGSAKTVREVYDWAVKQPDTAAAQAKNTTLALSKTAKPMAEPFFANTTPFFSNTSLPGNSPVSTGAIGPISNSIGLWGTSFDAGRSASNVSLLSTAGFSRAPFVLTPGVVQILASMTPDTAHTDDAKDENERAAA